VVIECVPLDRDRPTLLRRRHVRNRRVLLHRNAGLWLAAVALETRSFARPTPQKLRKLRLRKIVNSGLFVPNFLALNPGVCV